MQPVGLTTKRCRNKYASERSGELMIIHWCTDCETIVINRVAADDCTAALCEIFMQSSALDASLLDRLSGDDIDMLTTRDQALVWRRLFGASEYAV